MIGCIPFPRLPLSYNPQIFPFLLEVCILSSYCSWCGQASAHLEGVEEVPEAPGIDDIVVHGEEEGDHHTGNTCGQAEGQAEESNACDLARQNSGDIPRGDHFSLFFRFH